LIGSRAEQASIISQMRLCRLITTSANLLLLITLGCVGIRHSDTICAIPRDPSGSLYVTQHAGMAQAASRHGMKVYWNGPRGGDDTQQQIELMEHAIEKRSAGIVITPTAAFALDTVIQRALSKKIPVVIVGAPIPFPPDPNLSFVLNDIDQSAKIAADRIMVHQQVTAAYYAMIEQVDTDMGRMMEALEESGEADNTIVIFMSDHGEMLGDHGIYLKGPYFYDCLTRVPLIIRWPKHFNPGLKVDSLVELTDIAPTLLEAAGIPESSGVQGRSLMPLLTGQTTEHRDSVYMEYFDANATYEIPPMLTSVRTANWKLNYCDKPRSGELYDLEKDPGEFNNLCGDSHYRDAQQMMMHILVGRMIETTDPLPERHTSW